MCKLGGEWKSRCGSWNVFFVPYKNYSATKTWKWWKKICKFSSSVGAFKELITFSIKFWITWEVDIIKFVSRRKKTWVISLLNLTWVTICTEDGHFISAKVSKHWNKFWKWTSRTFQRKKKMRGENLKMRKNFSSVSCLIHSQFSSVISRFHRNTRVCLSD